MFIYIYIYMEESIGINRFDIFGSPTRWTIRGFDMFKDPSPYQWIGPRENLQEGIVFFSHQTWVSVLCLLEIAPFKEFSDILGLDSPCLMD